MNPAQLARLCKLWQKRLRLQDWVITVETVQEYVDEKLGTLLGHIAYDDEEMTASIQLVAGDQMEATLVHELLHLRLDAWPGEYHEPAKETAINILADCFVRAYPRRKAA